MTGMTEAGAGWDGGMRDGTNGDWAPPDSSSGVAVFARRAACGLLRSTTKVSGSGARRALKEELKRRIDSLAHSKTQLIRKRRVRAASVSPSAS